MPIEDLIVARTISPNRNSPRNHGVDTFTPHCAVGQVSAGWFCDFFSKASTGASCNWGIGSDGMLAQVVPEGDRSWCTSSAANDNRAITVECASDAFEPYAVNGKVWATLVGLAADVCRRHGKTKMVWLGDKEKSLAYEPKPGEMLITVHRWFANKSCPGDYIYNRLGLLAEEVNKVITGKGEEAMTKEEARKLFEEMYREENPTYNTLEDVPGYWRGDIQALVEGGIVQGVGGGRLGLSRSEAKMAVIVKRALDKLGGTK